jgi:pimeloyl-ACP methyl ester carboxylesterase
MSDREFDYLETKGGDSVLLLLHGLFGATGNFKGIQEYFGSKFNVVTPILPILTMDVKKLSLETLVEYIEDFVKYKGFKKVHLVGNSLGGHIAQLFALSNMEKVASITLTGSSGLFENSMGSTFPKRGDYDFVEKKAKAIFYDPEVATKEVIDEVFDIVNDRNKAIRVVVAAKSAVRNNLKELIHKITAPVLLVWGKQDTVTPSWVGEKFHELLPNSRLELFDKCGHAPMMELPHQFNTTLENFLNKV